LEIENEGGEGRIGGGERKALLPFKWEG